MPTAAIKPGCPDTPGVPVAGLDRRVRLQKELEKRGYRIVDESESPDRTVTDCHVLVGDDEIHLCADGVAVAERRLLQSLRKPIDGMVARVLNRRISLLLTRLLMHRRIHPNVVSVFALLVGLASGAVVAMGGYWAGVIGAALFQAQSVLDGVDGELARLRFQHSRAGQWLDTLGDDLSNLSFFVGMTVVMPAGWLRWVGIVGTMAFVVTEVVIYYALITIYRSGDLLDFKWDTGRPDGLGAKLGKLVKRDVFCLLAFVLALFGRLDVVLVLATAGALSTFVALVLQTARRGLRP